MINAITWWEHKGYRVDVPGSVRAIPKLSIDYKIVSHNNYCTHIVNFAKR